MAQARPAVRVGVFIATEAQFLDTACVDIFCVLGHAYLSKLGELVPVAACDKAPDVEILYISQIHPGGDAGVVELSAGARLVVDRHFSAADVAPGKLDVVLIPGPHPATVLEEAAAAWLAAHAASPGTDVLSVCTGIFVCGQAGLLTPGRTACGPRAFQDGLRDKYPGVSFVGDKLRWTQDGNLWSSGGVTNGNDLVSAYVRHNPVFPPDVVELALDIVETGDRPQEYETR